MEERGWGVAQKKESARAKVNRLKENGLLEAY